MVDVIVEALSILRARCELEKCLFDMGIIAAEKFPRDEIEIVWVTWGSTYAKGYEQLNTFLDGIKPVTFELSGQVNTLLGADRPIFALDVVFYLLAVIEFVSNMKVGEQVLCGISAVNDFVASPGEQTKAGFVGAQRHDKLLELAAFILRWVKIFDFGLGHLVGDREGVTIKIFDINAVGVGKFFENLPFLGDTTPSTAANRASHFAAS